MVLLYELVIGFGVKYKLLFISNIGEVNNLFYYSKFIFSVLITQPEIFNYNYNKCLIGNVIFII